MTDYDPDALYDVQAVRDHKGKPPFRQFFIKWENWDESTNTWEPEANLLYIEVAQRYCREKGLPPIVDAVVEQEKKKKERAHKALLRQKKEEEEEILRVEKKRRRKEAERRRVEEETSVKQKLPASPPAPQQKTSPPASPEILDLSSKGRAAVTSMFKNALATPPTPPLSVKLPVSRPRTVSVSSDSSVEFLPQSKPAKSASSSITPSRASSPSPTSLKEEIWNRESDEESSADEDGQDLFSVRKVLDVKGLAPNREFFVQWEGYDSEDDTWEPEAGVAHLDVVQEFMVQKQAETEARKKALKKRKRQVSEEKELKNAEKKVPAKARIASSSASTSLKKPVKASTEKSDKFSDAFSDAITKAGKKVTTFLSSDFKIPKAKTKTVEDFKTAWRKSLGLSLPDTAQASTSKKLHPILGSPILTPPISSPTATASTPENRQLKFVFPKSPAKPAKVIPPLQPVVEEVYGDIATGEQIVESFLNDDLTMAKMVFGQKVHEPENKADSVKTSLPDDLEYITRPPAEDRFVGLYYRLKYLRDTASGNRAAEVEVPSVTDAGHVFEKAMFDLEVRKWTRVDRIPEVIGNYTDYWKSRLLPAHFRAMGWDHPGSIMRCEPEEIFRNLTNALKEADVMHHLGRDVMNYSKQKSRQRCAKQIVRPARLRGPRRSSAYRR